jgi:hypothetical protein
VNDDATEITVDETDAATADDSAPEPETFSRAYVAELRAEAAAHRTKAAAAEETNTRLRDRLLDDPSDLAVFVDRSALVDDDGLPDPERITAEAERIAGERRHLAARRVAAVDVGQGPRGKAEAPDPFAAALRGAIG